MVVKNSEFRKHVLHIECFRVPIFASYSWNVFIFHKHFRLGARVSFFETDLTCWFLSVSKGLWGFWENWHKCDMPQWTHVHHLKNVFDRRRCLKSLILTFPSVSWITSSIGDSILLIFLYIELRENPCWDVLKTSVHM